ncbi:ABC transporter permease [Halobacterium sp. KA-6]|uniref:ABC transporter permease n=1 Tax=Halobacterium sp. KA-6 TaxID=2896368 RepID=UPI001E47A90C|nr:ABC transporter permease [Halobacterium sp. KA-6]MCD2205076.1 ABC transporter permease [Halobacterium sp. KA-6]
MGWFEEQVQDAIRDVLTAIKDALLGFTNEIFRAILRPIVGVPAPRSNDQYLVAGTPDNQPWQDLYADFYIQYILPLTIMLLIVGLAYLGVRAGSISQYRRKRLLRRIGLVFLGSFVWFPLVSLPLQFVNAIGVTLAPINDMAADFGALIESSVGGLFVVLAIALLATSLLLVAAFVYALRWLAILVLTPLMPLLGVFWALDVWPLSPASELARRAASLYPGLLLSGLPAAVLFRVGWQLDITASASGLFSLFLGLALIPAACLASILTVYWSSPAIKTIARNSVSKPNPRSAAAATKQSVGATARGARNVHRGLSEDAPGAITQDGRTVGDGGSRAYQVGEGVKATKSHARQYQNLRQSETGRMRDKAREDASRATAIAKARSKQALRNTKQSISRW